MKNRILAPFTDISFWIDVCAMYLISSIMSFLGVPWYLTAIFALITAIVVFILVLRKKNSIKEVEVLEKQMRAVIKKAKSNGDNTFIYDALEKELLPAIRKELPRKLYKYYQLSDDVTGNKRRFDSIRNNTIWESTCFEFNDPFECQYLYLNENDLLEMGIPNHKDAKKLWDSIMGQIQQRITTICFTQNPNDMPMWAHYANEHKGFCVEYLNTFNVLIPESNGSGAFETLVSPLIAAPEEGSADTFISMGTFASAEEAEYLRKYIKTKFARAMLGVKKVTQHNPKATWEYVPMQDFTASSDINWNLSISEIDNQLYTKYGLTEDEIAFVETMVKEME